MPGLQGFDGEKGELGGEGVPGIPGRDGSDGIDGQDGRPGENAYTPKFYLAGTPGIRGLSLVTISPFFFTFLKILKTLSDFSSLMRIQL